MSGLPARAARQRAADVLYQVGPGRGALPPDQGALHRDEAARQARAGDRARPRARLSRRADDRHGPARSRRHARAHRPHLPRARHRRRALVAPARGHRARLRLRRDPRRGQARARPADHDRAGAEHGDLRIASKATWTPSSGVWRTPASRRPRPACRSRRPATSWSSACRTITSTTWCATPPPTSASRCARCAHRRARSRTSTSVECRGRPRPEVPMSAPRAPLQRRRATARSTTAATRTTRASVSAGDKRSAPWSATPRAGRSASESAGRRRSCRSSSTRPRAAPRWSSSASRRFSPVSPGEAVIDYGEFFGFIFVVEGLFVADDRTRDALPRSPRARPHAVLLEGHHAAGLRARQARRRRAAHAHDLVRPGGAPLAVPQPPGRRAALVHERTISATSRRIALIGGLIALYLGAIGMAIASFTGRRAIAVVGDRRRLRGDRGARQLARRGPRGERASPIGSPSSARPSSPRTSRRRSSRCATSSEPPFHWWAYATGMLATTPSPSPSRCGATCRSAT